MYYKLIDLDTWGRAVDFNFFMDKGTQLIMSKNLDVTNYYHYRRGTNLRFFASMLYIISRSLNEVPEFRTSLNSSKKPILWNRLSPTYVVMNRKNSVINTTTRYDPDFATFYTNVIANIEIIREHELNVFKLEQPNYFVASYIRTDFNFAAMVSTKKMMDIPFLIWGKCFPEGFPEGDNIKMPITVEYHHAFADGDHHVQLFEKIGDYCRNPEESLKMNDPLPALSEV